MSEEVLLVGVERLWTWRPIWIKPHLFRIGGHIPFAEWLENPNLLLGG
jgi:hypothetical protein